MEKRNGIVKSHSNIAQFMLLSYMTQFVGGQR
jgi:hypothetical protein